MKKYRDRYTEKPIPIEIPTPTHDPCRHLPARLVNAEISAQRTRSKTVHSVAVSAVRRGSRQCFQAYSAARFILHFRLRPATASFYISRYIVLPTFTTYLVNKDFDCYPVCSLIQVKPSSISVKVLILLATHTHTHTHTHVTTFIMPPPP